MIQNRTLSVYLSMTEIQSLDEMYFCYSNYYNEGNLLLLRAFCASFVMASASSRIISLKPDLYIVPVLAKLRICPLTIPIPLSSEAFISNTYVEKERKESYEKLDN